MKARNYSGLWLPVLATVLASTSLFISGCSSGQTESTQETLAAAGGEGFAQNVLPTGEIVSGTTDVSSQVFPDEGSGTKSPACPKLDSQLNQVVTSPDPVGMAANLNLRVNEGKLQVIIVLAGDDLEFLKDFGIEAGSQAGQEVQAYMPIDRLCELAEREEVIAIRIPAQAVLP